MIDVIRGASIFTVVVLLMVTMNAVQLNAQTTSNTEDKVHGGMMVRIAVQSLDPSSMKEIFKKIQ